MTNEVGDYIMSRSNKNFEIELNENTVILHKHPDVDRICVWHPFEDFSQWQLGEAPLYGKNRSIVGYTADVRQYVVNICINILDVFGDSLILGYGHSDDFPNYSTELFASCGECPIQSVKYQNHGWEEWL